MKAFIFLLVVVCVGCGKKEQAKATPDASANKLFVETVKLIGSADEKSGEAAIKDYEQGLANIQTIIDNYSESDLAVKLISGETLFTGKSLKEIKERVKELKRVPGRKSPESPAPVVKERTIEDLFLAGELTKAELEKVKVLHLGDNQLTDMKSLEKVTQLTLLNLSYNQLTDVKGLENLTQLHTLSLRDNQLTSVKGLENLTQLEFLFLQNNPDLTKAQIAELQKALPKCRINFNAKK